MYNLTAEPCGGGRLGWDPIHSHVSLRAMLYGGRAQAIISKVLQAIGRGTH